MSDRDWNWKPTGRPQSTIAQSFSAALDDTFMIDNSLDGLARSVEQQKRAVSSQSAELKALEARLRETEERLKERQANTKNGYNSPDPREKAKSRQQVATLSSRPTQHDCQIRQSAYSRPFEPDVIQDKLPRLSK